MVSKTANLILLLHTTVSLLMFLLIQFFADSQPISIPWEESFLFYLSLHAYATGGTFLFTTLLKYCFARKSRRMSFKRHVFTALILAPLLAQIVGRWKGWLVNEDDDPVVWTAACYDQLDARDPSVILKSAFCELRHGLSRSKVEKWIGGRRERVYYVETLAKVCQEGLRDMGYSEGLEGGMCWIGKQDEWSEGEASEREWFKRGFEECHARFGVDAKLEWRGEQPLVKYRMPVIEGTKFNGEYIEMALDPSQFPI
ncbi:hypothetical protein N431DRAFT_447668 [Stipitochalara longipes BDJ]|nr:hypothetical protein N431DRAFT_447668 [Stipitochalara longipes BDJ]